MKLTLVLSLLILAMSVQAQDQVDVQLVPGWNLISINVIPPQEMFQEDEDRGPNVPLMFERLRLENGQHQVLYVKDHNGRFYTPAWDYCNIPFWNLTRGLAVEVNEEVVVTWEGERIPADADIQLTEFYRHIVAYYPTYELNANPDDFYVLSPIIENVRYAVDEQGRFMMPRYNFSNMDPWRPGEGYWIYVDEDVVLNYPEERDEEPVMFEGGDHWETLLLTSAIMPVLLSVIDGPEGFEPEEGDQVGAFRQDGDFVGYGDVHDGMCGLAVWGADPGEDEVGLQYREEFSMLYWDEDQDAEYEINIEEVDHWHDGLRFNSRCYTIVEVSVDVQIQESELIVPLEEGWNMISINVSPGEEMWEREEGPDVILMLDQLRIDEENHHVLLMKDEAGNFYHPAWDFNNIPYWNLTEGYQILVDEEIEAVWSGEQIPADADIPLEEGWNIIAYFPSYELDASSSDFYVLSPIIDHVLIAKDGQGNFMLPDFEFSNMPPWRETQGYQIKVDEDVVLNYPEEPEDGAFAFNTPPLNPPLLRSGGGSARYFPGEESKGGASRPHWTFPKPTGRNMSVLIEVGQASLPEPVAWASPPEPTTQASLPAIGDQIAAFNSDGLLVGVGRAGGVARKVAGGDAYATGLAVWGDDPSTDEVDGMLEGETFSLKLWDSDRKMEIDLETDAVLTGQGTVYETNGFSALEVKVKPSVPDAFYLAQNYPNPFNSVTTIKFGLPEQDQVHLNILDVTGREVAMIINSRLEAGYHRADWDASGIPSGIYFARLSMGRESRIIKIICAR